MNRAKSPIRWAADLFVTAILLASVYFGFENTDDITNTTTLAEQAVGALATGYALVGLVSLFGYWQSTRWLRTALLIWSALVVVTGTLASAVYGGIGWGVLLALVICLGLVALVLWAARPRMT